MARRSLRRRRIGPDRPLAGAATALVIVAAIVVAGLVGWRTWHRRETSEPLPPDVGVIVDHVDGDTADIAINDTVERVRFIGIDTPESYRADGPPDCYGREAAQRTRELLPIGTEVRLANDVVGRDDYGRLLAYVYRRSDELFVNHALLAEGYARPLSIRPNTTYAASFVAATTAAERAGLGLWSACRTAAT